MIIIISDKWIDNWMVCCYIFPICSEHQHALFQGIINTTEENVAFPERLLKHDELMSKEKKNIARIPPLNAMLLYG